MEISGSAGGLIYGGNPVGYAGYSDVAASGYGNPARLNNGWQVVGRFTVNTGRWLSHEAGAGYGRNSLDLEWNDLFTIHYPRASTIGFYDLLLCATPQNAQFRPCIAAGGHVIRYDVAGQTLEVLGNEVQTKAGLNFGGTAKFRLGENWYVRFDLRDYTNPKPFGLLGKEGWMHQTEVSAGFGLRF